MKKLVLSILLGILCFYSCIGQTETKIDETTYAKLVDYVCCCYTNAYIENVVRSISEDRDDKKAYDQIIKPKLSGISIDNHLSPMELFGLLNENHWSNTAALSDAWRKNKNFPDLQKTNKDIIENLVAVDDGFQKKIPIELTKIIKKELLSKYTIATLSGGNLTQPSGGEKPGTGPTSEKDNHKLLWTLFVVLAIIVLYSKLILFYQKLRPKEQKKKDSRTYTTTDSTTVFQTDMLSTGQKEAIRNEVNTRIKKIFENTPMKGEGNKLSDVQIDQILDALMPKAKELIENTIKEYFKGEDDKGELSFGEITEKQDNNFNMSGVKYLKTIQDGVFHSTSNIPSDCFFRLFNEKGKTANFDFCGDERAAIANKDSIKEVCETMGSSIDARSIQNIENGAGSVVQQEDGTWKVSQKAKIKFL